MNREKIIEIARYRGENQLICKSCGCISPVEKIDLEFNGSRVRANCPECGAYIKFLSTAKAWRIWKNKGAGMVEIELLKTDYLQWFLKTRPGNNTLLIEAVELLLDRRISDPAQYAEPIKDVDASPDIKNLEDRKEIGILIATKKQECKTLVHSCRAMDATATEKVINQLRAKQKIISQLEKSLLKLSAV